MQWKTQKVMTTIREYIESQCKRWGVDSKQVLGIIKRDKVLKKRGISLDDVVDYDRETAPSGWLTVLSVTQLAHQSLLAGPPLVTVGSYITEQCKRWEVEPEEIIAIVEADKRFQRSGLTLDDIVATDDETGKDGWMSVLSFAQGAYEEWLRRSR